MPITDIAYAGKNSTVYGNKHLLIFQLSEKPIDVGRIAGEKHFIIQFADEDKITFEMENMNSNNYKMGDNYTYKFTPLGIDIDFLMSHEMDDGDMETISISKRGEYDLTEQLPTKLLRKLINIMYFIRYMNGPITDRPLDDNEETDPVSLNPIPIGGEYFIIASNSPSKVPFTRETLMSLIQSKGFDFKSPITRKPITNVQRFRRVEQSGGRKTRSKNKKSKGKSRKL